MTLTTTIKQFFGITLGATALTFSIGLAQLAWADPVNINNASAEELADNLTGVGLKKAQAIVAWREANGSFQSTEELAKVKGIGAATLAKNSDNILLK